MWNIWIKVSSHQFQCKVYCLLPQTLIQMALVWELAASYLSYCWNRTSKLFPRRNWVLLNSQWWRITPEWCALLSVENGWWNLKRNGLLCDVNFSHFEQQSLSTCRGNEQPKRHGVLNVCDNPRRNGSQLQTTFHIPGFLNRLMCEIIWIDLDRHNLEASLLYCYYRFTAMLLLWLLSILYIFTVLSIISICQLPL